MNKIVIYTVAILSFFVQHAQAQDLSLYQKYKLVQNGDTMLYRILLPDHFDASKKYPLVIFLHGSGERGDDNERQLTHGARLFLENRQSHPAIVVFPQCSRQSFWANVQFLFNDKGDRTLYYVPGGEPSTAMKMLMVLVNNLFIQYKIQKDQVYAIGLSMGGMGTFELVNRMPHTFAAAVPICGGANAATVPNLRSTKWWVFHGADDNIVPPSHSEQIVQAMKRAGMPVKFTLYPGVGHNSWENAFKEPGLLPWLFSQKLSYKNAGLYNN